MAGIGFLHRIHAKGSKGIDRQLIQIFRGIDHNVFS
jgi:hypothetical protein